MMQKNDAVDGNAEAGLGFTVDTHIFRELGDLLVGRDSTALAELIKNAYDADARRVQVHGTDLSDPARGVITIIDDGHGMTPDTFKIGFLRVAGRQKETGSRRSPKYARRFTGEKGIGRLAAHKLARKLEIISVPDKSVLGDKAQAFKAVIDWERIEELNTLDEVRQHSSQTDLFDPLPAEPRPAVRLSVLGPSEIPFELQPHGTKISLHPLRRSWTEGERIKLYNEAQDLQFPAALLGVDERLFPGEKLINLKNSRFHVRDAGATQEPFSVDLAGDFSVGESFWQALFQQRAWLVEVDATSKTGPIRYRVSPSSRIVADRKISAFQSQTFSIDRTHEGPGFFARLLIRDGQVSEADAIATEFIRKTFGVRVYVEGFRVLPYGEPGNDWLKLDYDYARRTRKLTDGDWLDEMGESDRDVGLSIPPGRAVFGAVIMTQESSVPLRMLVNREGFVPDGAYDDIVSALKSGINLFIRHKAAATRAKREDSRNERSTRAETSSQNPLSPSPFERAQSTLEKNVEEARSFATQADQLLRAGDVGKAREAVYGAAQHLRIASQAASQILPEQSLMRLLASVGLQLGAFVHEVRAVHGMAGSLRSEVERHLESDPTINTSTRRFLKNLQRRISDLTQSLERHASYLTDTLSADSRRRRSAQFVLPAVERALRLVETQIERRKIEVEIDVAENVRTPPMFAPEITLILTNLLTNAVKAAGEGGKIHVQAREEKLGVSIRIENTGDAVELEESERWFQPFESRSLSPDPVLGIGMGMGLPITRNMIETYGGEIAFVAPTSTFSTAVHFTLPK